MFGRRVRKRKFLGVGKLEVEVNSQVVAQIPLLKNGVYHIKDGAGILPPGNYAMNSEQLIAFAHARAIDKHPREEIKTTHYNPQGKKLRSFSNQQT